MPYTWVQRNYRVEVPVWGHDNDVIFDTADDAVRFARQWAVEDKVLVMVWSFAGAYYIARFDGRS
jgi:hypothetical protein